MKEIVKLIYQRGMSQEQQALNFGILAILEKQSTKFKQNLSPVTMTKINRMNE